MKYHAPERGKYESGLTPTLMYNTVEGLIKAHAPVEYERIMNTPNSDFDRLLKTSEKRDEGKLWERHKIRSGLEEFVSSYIFTGLKGLSPIKKIFRGDTTPKEKCITLDKYLVTLKNQYGPDSKKYKAVSESLAIAQKRYTTLEKKIKRIKYTKGNKIIKRNAQDAFASISTIYGYI